MCMPVKNKEANIFPLLINAQGSGRKAQNVRLVTTHE